eukprot:TRINITY_DN8363_c0_g1_i1.p1 TRINITY_DN8363_c0_g1~~TRINITY_DN8363_c0_g1_i1.p1  ORF type:complete len:354 (-),score=82.49 TRINITY_DN8363_c0_g1_i1:92-1153(-)
MCIRDRQNTAGAGTFILEFGVLSALTGDWRFARAAHAGLHALWKLRSGLNLLGNTVDVRTGKWIHRHAGVGAGSDSFYEYLLKCYVLFDDQDCLSMFLAAYDALLAHAFKDPWYVEASMSNGNILYAEAQGLQSFWPGLQVLHGDLARANRTHRAFHSLWRRYGVLPERHSLMADALHSSERYYLLRPEHVESTYHLYRASNDQFYLHVAQEIAASLEKRTRTRFGYASIHDVSTGEKEDRMCSFFLAETLKYLYLVFDPGNFAHGAAWCFSTEGHLLRLPEDKAAGIRARWRREFPSKLADPNRGDAERVCLSDQTLALKNSAKAVSYTHLRAHETPEHLVCRLLLEKKKKH